MSYQLTIEQAIAERLAREGMDRALEHAESEIPKWGDLALDFIQRYAQKHERFCGWMVVKAASLDPNFPAPPNEKAWGGPIKKAAAKGIIARDGTGKDPHRHGNMIPVWRSRIYTKLDRAIEAIEALA